MSPKAEWVTPVVVRMPLAIDRPEPFLGELSEELPRED